MTYRSTYSADGFSKNLPIIGIAFNLILMRTNQRRADEEMGSEDKRNPVSELQFHHTIFETLPGGRDTTTTGTVAIDN